MESRSGGAGRSRGPARRTRRRPARMATRMRGRGGARRQHRAASAPQARARRGGRNAPGRRRRDERAPRDGAGITVKVRPISGNGGRGRRESAWTPRRPGAKAISRLPSPRGARRNMRFRKSLDRRKSDAPIRHTHDRPPPIPRCIALYLAKRTVRAESRARSGGAQEMEKQRSAGSPRTGSALPAKRESPSRPLSTRAWRSSRQKNWGISKQLERSSMCGKILYISPNVQRKPRFGHVSTDQRV